MGKHYLVRYFKMKGVDKIEMRNCIKNAATFY